MDARGRCRSSRARWLSVSGLAGLTLAFLACGGGGDGGSGSDDRGGEPVDGRGSTSYEVPGPGSSTTWTEPTDESVPEPTGVEPVSVDGTDTLNRVIRVNVSYGEAESAYLDRRYEDAVDLFTAYTEQRPENVWGHYMLGLSTWKAGRPDQAELAFERALDLDPEHVKSLVNLSRVRLEVDRPEDAVSTIDRAAELDPESAAVQRVRGRVQHELGDLDAAIESYRTALILDETDVWSMNNLAFIYIQQERFEDALPPLARATELAGDVAVFRNNLGIALERTGHFGTAAESYGAALEIDDGYEKARTSLARVETLEADPALEPVDLSQLAQRFRDDLEGWREPPVATGAAVPEPRDAEISDDSEPTDDDEGYEVSSGEDSPIQEPDGGSLP